MAGFGRAKRVTGPLDERVKARIFGKTGDEPEDYFFSSGSEHGGENDDDESPCLSHLVHGFLENGDGGVDSPSYESDSERDPSMSDATEAIEDLVNPAETMSPADPIRNMLQAHVSKAIAMFSCFKSDKPAFRRKVMAFLRELGFNAAICKTKWEGCGGITAGNYEFIDVVRSDSAASKSQYYRYFVDLEFSGEFEIARPTRHYERLLEAFPRVFVGRGEELKQIVKVTSDAAKRSLKNRGLSLAPWRKNRYMQNKWFGPYRRTTNALPANSTSITHPTAPDVAVNCRSVGFDGVGGSLFDLSIFPATNRTSLLNTAVLRPRFTSDHMSTLSNE